VLTIVQAAATQLVHAGRSVRKAVSRRACPVQGNDDDTSSGNLFTADTPPSPPPEFASAEGSDDGSNGAIVLSSVRSSIDELYPLKGPDVFIRTCYKIYENDDNSWITRESVADANSIFSDVHQWLLNDTKNQVYFDPMFRSATLIIYSHFMNEWEIDELRRDPNYYAIRYPDVRHPTCIETPGWNMKLSNDWFKVNKVIDRENQLFICFFRVDLPMVAPDTMGVPGATIEKTAVFCTMGTPHSRFLFRHSFKPDVAYEEFIETILFSIALQVRWVPVFSYLEEPQFFHTPDDFDLYLVKGELTETDEHLIAFIAGEMTSRGPKLYHALSRLRWAGIYHTLPLISILPPNNNYIIVFTSSVKLLKIWSENRDYLRYIRDLTIYQKLKNIFKIHDYDSSL
jgi:hypothetical protein